MLGQPPCEGRVVPWALRDSPGPSSDKTMCESQTARCTRANLPTGPPRPFGGMKRAKNDGDGGISRQIHLVRSRRIATLCPSEGGSRRSSRFSVRLTSAPDFPVQVFQFRMAGSLVASRVSSWLAKGSARKFGQRSSVGRAADL